MGTGFGLESILDQLDELRRSETADDANDPGSINRAGRAMTGSRGSEPIAYVVAWCGVGCAALYYFA
ncbi:MAG: hypothetical protein WBS18_00975, partial [Candidatus Acidiferrales bacterium]